MSKRKSKRKHWKKEESERNENRILTHLEIKDMRFNELQQEIPDMSPTTLDKHLKTLLNKKLISRYWNEEKKANYYQVNPESKDQVTGTLGKYEAIQFIKSIQNPVYSNETEEKFKVSAFSSVPATVNRKRYESAFRSMVSKRTLKMLKRVIKVKPNVKMALVIMIEGDKP